MMFLRLSVSTEYIQAHHAFLKLKRKLQLSIPFPNMIISSTTVAYSSTQIEAIT